MHGPPDNVTDVEPDAYTVGFSHRFAHGDCPGLQRGSGPL